MHNGSIVLRESTLNLVLPRLTKESPIIFFFLLYILQPSSRKKLIILMYILEKTNENQRSTPRALFHPPPPSWRCPRHCPSRRNRRRSRPRNRPRRCNVSTAYERVFRSRCEKNTSLPRFYQVLLGRFSRDGAEHLGDGRNVNRRRWTRRDSVAEGSRGWTRAGRRNIPSGDESTHRRDAIGLETDTRAFGVTFQDHLE